MAPTRALCARSRPLVHPLHPSPPRALGPRQSYPINKLRNVAIRAVRTSHFLVLDVDLWPSASMATIIANLVPVKLLRRKLAALVVARVEKSAGGVCTDPPPQGTAEAARPPF